MLITPSNHPDVGAHAVAALGNPFAALLNPEVVIQRMERSEDLKRLGKRVLRPLERPWIPYRVSPEVAASDAAVDAEDV